MPGKLEFEHKVVVCAAREVRPTSGDFARVAIKLLHPKIRDCLEAYLSNEGRSDARIELMPREVWYDLLAPEGLAVPRMNGVRRESNRHCSFKRLRRAG
jgi:hypothetical protein